MARKSPYRPYTPSAEQLALHPEISGNTINGLGEKDLRRADPLYWHDPDTLAHGELQKWFYTQNPDNEAVAKARKKRALIQDEELPPVQGQAIAAVRDGVDGRAQTFCRHAGTGVVRYYPSQS